MRALCKPFGKLPNTRSVKFRLALHTALQSVLELLLMLVVGPGPDHGANGVCYKLVVSLGSQSVVRYLLGTEPERANGFGHWLINHARERTSKYHNLAIYVELGYRTAR